MKELRTSAFYKVHDAALCEDLVQDTFIKTWSYVLKGGKIKMMRAFLYHVLNNLIVDEYRKRRHKTVSLDDLAKKGYEPSEDASGRFYDFLDGETALSSIKRLPPKYQLVMRMRYAQGLSLGEMALISGQSKNTISVQAHRGLMSLRELHAV
jgi:RNA polymerase sigma-70 factor (ECF subfamily)